MTKIPPIELDGTRVDLGEDLLQTKTVQRPSPEGATTSNTSAQETLPPQAQGDTVDELVLNAKILRNEGLIDEAKRTLRRALIVDRSHVPAKQLLAAIHADEVSAILKGGDSMRSSRLKGKRSPLDTDDTPAETLSRLEMDLKISEAEPDPFATEEDRTAFLRQIDTALIGEEPGNRVDFGIAFMEMGLLSLARTQFEAAIREPETERKGTLLLATCYIMQNEPFQALLLLDPWVADPTRGPEEKLEVGYLMARAYEDLRRLNDATIWYRSVVEIDPGYRDSLERLQRCEKTRS